MSSSNDTKLSTALDEQSCHGGRRFGAGTADDHGWQAIDHPLPHSSSFPSRILGREEVRLKISVLAEIIENNFERSQPFQATRAIPPWP